MSAPHRVVRVVSGGQTGVDRAALDAALLLGIAVGGWCPKGRSAEDGPIDARYPLRETDEEDPAERTRRNVRDADGTLLLVRRPTGPAAFPGRAAQAASLGGTRTAFAWARRLAKPVLAVDPGDVGEREAVRAWIARCGLSTLNVAGPRESECPGIYAEAKAFLLAVLGEGEATG